MLFYLLILYVSYSLSASVPIARYVTLLSSALSENVITLLPYNTNGNISFLLKIATLPALGTIYQTSFNYENYGYTPTRSTQITSSNTLVTSTSNKIVYVAPANFAYTYLTYSVTDLDGVAAASSGYVVITKSDLITILSTFWIDNESWTVENAISTAASWSATSTGNLNYFIYGGDFDPSIGYNNDVRWYFKAPSKFLGNQAFSYNGYLSFYMGAFAGDFATYGRATPFDFVQLTCSTCMSGAGMILTQRFATFDGSSVKLFNFTLNELPASGWLIDPKNNLVSTWASPTQCQFISVLMGLTSVKIFGDLTTSYEVIGIDAISYTAGPSNSIPTSCY